MWTNYDQITTVRCLCAGFRVVQLTPRPTSSRQYLCFADVPPLPNGSPQFVLPEPLAATHIIEELRGEKGVVSATH